MNNFDLRKFLKESKTFLKEENIMDAEQLVSSLEKQLGSNGPTQYKINGAGRMASNLEKYLKDKLSNNNEPSLEDLANALSSFLVYNFEGMEVDTSMGDTIVRPKGSNEFHIQLNRTSMKEAEIQIPSDVKNVAKVQSQSTSMNSANKRINTTQEFTGAFENWFKSLGYEPGKVTKSFIRTEMDKVLSKLGYK